MYVYIVVGPKLDAFVKLSDEEENLTLKSRIQRSVSAFFSPGRLDMEGDVWECVMDLRHHKILLWISLITKNERETLN